MSLHLQNLGYTSILLIIFNFLYSAGSSGHCNISESSSNNSDLSERLSERMANSPVVHVTATTTGVAGSPINSKPAAAHVTSTLTAVSPTPVTSTSKPASGSSGETCNDVLSNLSSNNTSNTTSSVNHRQVS
jgi:hypothetical protein